MSMQNPAAANQRTIIPQVRYHPSIHPFYITSVPCGVPRGAGALQPCTGRQSVAEVRYHPSITTAGSQTSAKPTQRSTAGAARHPQARTQPKMVPNNQDSSRNGPAVRPHVVRGLPDNDPDSAGDQALSKPAPRSRTRAGRAPQTRTKPKKALENQDCSSTGPAARPNLDGGQEPERDSGSDEDRAPPTPDLVPLDLRANLNKNLLQQVEILTRGQSTNQDWFAWRKNRITASVAHRIAHSKFVNGRSKAPPASYLAAVTGEGPKVQTRAMSWGINMEAEVVRRYQRLKTAALGRPVSVLECGLFIDSERPWLAASPDGIVTDRRTGQRLLCLEVKCPYKHRNRSVEDACREDPAFCLQLQDEDQRSPDEPPVYVLKTSHTYFTQIQVQLAVTGLQQADLVVFTTKETAIVPVEFDPELWAETVSKLEVFYRDAVLPHVRQKMQQNPAAAAAMMPEL
ncbi:uncharacterized protein LOC105924198 [Fundulus heteroclitus]|uniref:uncharacterized protein LOC105924198 n=1 Tax=Fundulus heteroclitus TaxID=8078 RepID=UPI00165A2DA0|nr:uncharacterized protein LOC105924198 [Fundulus heteroclitus]